MDFNELLDKCINDKLIMLTISNARKTNKTITKVKIRPVIIKSEMLYQVSEYVGTKVLHENMGECEVKQKISEYISVHFKQAQFQLTDSNAQVLASDKGKLTVKYTKNKELRAKAPMEHNRTKKYILDGNEPVEFLIDLGVQTKDGKIVKSRYDKFRQINRFLEFIEDILPQLDKKKEQTIIDFGCGKSYLTFAMYYYLKVMKGFDIRVIGLDLKEDVIENCNTLAKRYGFDKLSFYVGDIASYTDVASVDMVVTLHACDTATDYALAKAVKWGAKVILSVPCCQHEANAQIKSEVLEPVLKYGILKERISAIFTDAMRANMLEANGYQTQILEFIDMEHTPKNLLIRAVYTGNMNNEAAAASEEMAELLNLKLTINRLIGGNDEEQEKISR